MVYWQEEQVSDNFDKHVCRSVLWVVDFDHHLYDETQVKTPMNRTFVGKSDQTMTPEWSLSIKLSSHQIFCAQVMFKMQVFPPYWCVFSHLFSKSCWLGMPYMMSLQLHVG